MKVRLKLALLVSVLLVLVLWLVKLWEISFDIDFSNLGVYPRQISGLKGIIFAPLVHANFKHLYSNSLPLFVLTFTLFYFYPRQALKVLIVGWLMTYALLWLIGRPGYHIGASGLVYMLTSFCIFSGLFSMKKSLLAISLAVIFLYGSSIWGMIPSFAFDRSWEGHLSGYIVGFVLALSMVKNEPDNNSNNGNGKKDLIFNSQSDADVDFDYWFKEDFLKAL